MSEVFSLRYFDQDGTTHDIEHKQGSVLDTLLEKGIDVAHSCKAGLCQSCLLECREGSVPDKAKTGLKSSLADAGYFLACQCHPEAPMTVASIDAEKSRSKANVVSLERFESGVLKLRLSASDSDFAQTFAQTKGGQYFTLWKDAATGRSYSNASASSSDFLEFHIKHLENGAFSNWAATQLQVGDSIDIQGPLGTCCYSAKDQEILERPLILAGIGTGLAPLLGVLKDALSHEHQGPIEMILASKQSSAFYLVEELSTLEAQHENLSIHWLYQESSESGEKPSNARCENVYEFVKALDTEWPEALVYLCGAESFVKKMKRQCFMSGAAMNNIFADSFVH